MMQVSKVWWDGNKMMEKPINPDAMYLPPKPMGIEALVCEEITLRQQKGINKYGTTVADNNLSLREWLQHQYEELLDAAVYCRRAIAEIDKQSATALDKEREPE
jgi:hypothetical protein